MSRPRLLRDIDDYLIDRIFEPISSWTHTWFGCTNFVMVRVLCISTLILHHIKSQASSMSQRALMTSLSFMALLVAVVVLRSFALEQKLKKSEEGRCVNEERSDRIMMFVRVGLCFILLLDACDFAVTSKHGWGVLSDISVTAMYYFNACSSRPRQRGRVLSLLFAGSRI